MPRLPLLAALIALSAPSAIAADVQPEVKPPAAAPAPAATAPAAKPDPTAAVVAEGRFTYRQRDLDALMLIAQRHAKAKLGRADEERLRQALLQMLVAREPLLDAMAGLPTVFGGKTRDALVLDLLDYQGEPATAKDAAAVPPASGASPTPATADNGPLLVRLPVLTLTRNLEGIGKRTLALGLALVFRDAAQAKALEAKAPVIQDAILGYVQRLPPAQFAEPDQVALKDGLTKTVIGKVPDFPVDGILIPQLDVSVPEASDKAAPAR